MRVVRTGAVVLLVMVAGAARGEELRAPRNVKAEPWSKQSSELATQSAKAEMRGAPQEAVTFAEQAIRSNPQDPWPYYDKGMALARLGQTDAAVAALSTAEQRFSTADRWGRSVAIYGRAHTLAAAGRCAEARQAFDQYAKFVEAQAPDAAVLARRYAAECRSPATPPTAATPAAAPPPAPGSEAPGTP